MAVSIRRAPIVRFEQQTATAGPGSSISQCKPVSPCMGFFPALRPGGQAVTGPPDPCWTQLPERIEMKCISCYDLPYHQTTMSSNTPHRKPSSKHRGSLSEERETDGNKHQEREAPSNALIVESQCHHRASRRSHMWYQEHHTRSGSLESDSDHRLRDHYNHEANREQKDKDDIECSGSRRRHHDKQSKCNPSHSKSDRVKSDRNGQHHGKKENAADKDGTFRAKSLKSDSRGYREEWKQKTTKFISKEGYSNNSSSRPHVQQSDSSGHIKKETQEAMESHERALPLRMRSSMVKQASARSVGSKKDSPSGNSARVRPGITRHASLHQVGFPPNRTSLVRRASARRGLLMKQSSSRSIESLENDKSPRTTGRYLFRQYSPSSILPNESPQEEENKPGRERVRSGDPTHFAHDLTLLTSPMTPDHLKQTDQLKNLATLALQASSPCMNVPLLSPHQDKKRRPSITRKSSLLNMLGDRPGAALQRMSVLSASKHQQQNKKSWTYV